MNRKGLAARRRIAKRILKAWNNPEISYKDTMILGNDRKPCSCDVCTAKTKRPERTRQDGK